MEEPDKSVAPFHSLVSGPLASRFYNSKLADRLQTRRNRRSLALLYAAVTISYGFFVYLFVEYIQGHLGPLPDYATMLIVVGGPLVLALGVFLDTMMVVSIRPAMPVPGQPFDERQQMLCLKAHADARYLVIFLMVVAVLAGAMKLKISVFVAIGVVAIVFAMMAPHFMLTWQLPDEADDDGSESEAEDD